MLFYPAFHARDALSDHVHRAHWYLRPFHDALTEVIAAHMLDDACIGPTPDYLDPTLADQAAHDPLVGLRRIEDEAAMAALVRDADIVLHWDCDPAAPAPAVLKGKPVVRIDHHTGQYAGSHYLKLAERFFPALQEQYRRESAAVFARILARCAGKTGYIFGTGPGLAHASAHDFSDGVAIACNSMVRNHALMERLQPPLIVVGDPIFHAGPSTYAAAFRAALIEALDRYGADLIVPLRDYHIYRTHLPARFAARIAAVPFVAADAPNLDLAQALQVTTTSNVLTLFLIPLAATFFEDIRIFGCDGRPLDQNGYFWSHDKASQFNDEMAAIRRAHPAFFAIDYDDYYLTHCNTLETWLSAAEAAGKRVTNHTPSFIPALIARTIPGVGEPARAAPAVSIVMPAYNAAPFIEEAVRSVIAQDFTDWELLIVEDGSTDETPAIATRLAAGDPRVTLLRNPRKGVSAARNTGVEAARGRYIGFLDADDTLDPGSIAARAEALDADPTLNLVHSVVRRTDEEGRDLGRFGAQRDITFSDMWRNPIHINTLLGRSDVIKTFTFDETIANGEDWLMLARMLRSGLCSRHVPNSAATWRMQPNSTTFNAMARHEEGLLAVIDWVYAPCAESWVASELTDGLQMPEKSEVRTARRFTLLIWHLLSDDQDAVRYGGQDQAVAIWAEQNEARCKILVEAVCSRFFRQPVGELRTLSTSKRRHVWNQLSRSGLAVAIPSLAKAVIDVLDLRAALTLFGPFERADDYRFDEVDVVRSLFRTGRIQPQNEVGLMLDVGACKGNAFIGFAKMGWQVHAFEPNPPMHDYIVQNRALPGVTINQLAVSEVSGEEVPFFTSEESVGISSLAPFRDTHKSTAIVKTVRMEDYAVAHGIDHADFLKIDTEGFDLMVLRSLDWARFKPTVVVCEFEDNKTNNLGYCVGDLAEFLLDRGYTVFASEWHPITRYGAAEYHSWRALHRWDRGIVEAQSWGNLIAFRDSINETEIVEAVQREMEAVRARASKAAQGKKTSPVVVVDNRNFQKQAIGPASRRHSIVLATAGTLFKDVDDVLICEEQVENWDKQQCSLHAAEAWFPAGGPGDMRAASRVIENNAEAVHGLRRLISVGRAGSVEIAGFARSAGRESIDVWVGEEGAGATFDLVSAHVAHVKGSSAFPVLDVEMHRSAGEWGEWRYFRIVIQMSQPITLQTQINMRAGPRGITRYRGNGRSGVDFWGLHVFASSDSISGRTQAN